jgi:tetratricopeptide (TPR) repeat protein
MHYNDREERQARQAHAVGLLAAEELIRLSSSPEYSLLAARLYRAVGSDLRRANDVPGALQSVHRSRELLEQLPAEDPPNQHRMEEQAEVYRLIGFMERGQKRYPIALDWLGQAVRLNEQLVAANRNQSSLMRLASSLDNIASVHAALGRNDDEFKALRQCRETMREALAMGDSLNPQAKRFGQVCHRLGKLANELGDSETARSAFEEGAAAFEKLATERDLTADGTLNRAECHAFLAAHLAAAGEREAAIASYELAVNLLKRTGTPSDADPRHKDRYRKTLASLNALKAQP